MSRKSTSIRARQTADSSNLLHWDMRVVFPGFEELASAQSAR